MAITSIVVVADDETIEGGGATLEFTPGNTYPVRANHPLYVRNQPFPASGEPTRVVSSIVSLWLSYGHYDHGNGVAQQPPPFVPDEHWVREVTFSADYVPGSWQVAGGQASLQVALSGGIRDNTPANGPDDAFVAYLRVQAICIWTTEVTLLEQLAREVREVGHIFKG